jgi:hypothetical protein
MTKPKVVLSKKDIALLDKKVILFFEEILKKAHADPRIAISCTYDDVSYRVNYTSDESFVSSYFQEKTKKDAYSINLGVENIIADLYAAIEAGESEEKAFGDAKDIFLYLLYHETQHVRDTWFGKFECEESLADYESFCLICDNIFEDIRIDYNIYSKVPRRKRIVDAGFNRFHSSPPIVTSVTSLGDAVHWFYAFCRGKVVDNDFYKKYGASIREFAKKRWETTSGKERVRLSYDFFLALARDFLSDESMSASFISGYGDIPSRDITPFDFKSSKKLPDRDSAVPSSESPFDEKINAGLDSSGLSDGESKDGGESSPGKSVAKTKGSGSDSDSDSSSGFGSGSGSDSDSEKEKALAREREKEKAEAEAEAKTEIKRELDYLNGLSLSFSDDPHSELLLYGQEIVLGLDEVSYSRYFLMSKVLEEEKYAKMVVAPYILEVQSKIQELVMETKARMVSGNPTGKVNIKNIIKKPGLVDYMSWFDKKKGEDLKQDTVVTLLVDCSGSMDGSRARNAFYATTLFDEVFTLLGIPHQIEYFSLCRGASSFENLKSSPFLARKSVVGKNGFTCASTLIVREFDDTDTATLFFDGMTSRLSFSYRERPFLDSGNSDPFNVSGALRRLKSRIEKRKILIVISDGEPAYDDVGGYGTRRSFRSKCDNLFKNIVAQEKEVFIYGIGVETYAVKEFYPNNFVLSKSEELVSCVDSLINKILFGT